MIFLAYALDTADACHALGIQTVAVTAGCIHDAPRREFYAKMDSVNIDLNGFTDDFYVKLTGGHLQSVLNTLAYVHHNTDCWLEITALLIPGRKDSEAKIKALRTCVANELGSEVLLHCSAFHPEMRNKKLPDVSENSKKPFGPHQIPAYMRAEQS